MTNEQAMIMGVIVMLALVTLAVYAIVTTILYKKLNREILDSLDLPGWKYLSCEDELITVKSSKSVDNYDAIKFFKEDRSNLDKVAKVLDEKKAYAKLLNDFLVDNEFVKRATYSSVVKHIKKNLPYTEGYFITVFYRSPAGKSTNVKTISIDDNLVNELYADPSLIMGKSEYNKYIKEQNKELIDNKHKLYYGMVNTIIDKANEYRDKLIIKGDQNELDRSISSLFEKTVNSIKKIKSLDSEEWKVIKNVISNTENEVDKIIARNKKIYEYYDSQDFKKIKDTCNSLMESQRDFNEYINEKAQSISSLFGSRIVRNETEVNDEYNYIRPYKKSITPFTAEVSSAIFASAENNPLEYIVKYFYPNKELYPDQIQKLQLLVEELETLKDAKQIIENYKKDYQQYLTDVPSFIMENDEDGFYERLGFANISESVLTVEYKFSYTSGGGMAQRSFTIPMTEETIVELVNMLQGKLTMSAFAKEQRNMMTSKLRQLIKERDNYTCKFCGNSTFAEPNLLLEIDHIIPVAKGGCTVEDNLQTLCWKCNRQKSSKIIPTGEIIGDEV